MLLLPLSVHRADISVSQFFLNLAVGSSHHKNLDCLGQKTLTGSGPCACCFKNLYQRNFPIYLCQYCRKSKGF
jgi:hypothetical protein